MTDGPRYDFKDVSCNICKTNDTVYLGRRESLFIRQRLLEKTGDYSHSSLKIFKCLRCGLIYPNPMPVPNEAQLQKNFIDPDNYFPTESNEKRLLFYKKLLSRIERVNGRKGRLLDIGCGRGELVYMAGKAGWDAEGIDTSISFVNFAKDHFGIKANVGKLEDMNFQRESFDVVCLASVLQHVLDPVSLLRDVNRILKKGGLLYMENINNNALIYSLGDLYYRFLGQEKTTCLSPTFPSYQIYGFSVPSLRAICGKTGFKIAKTVLWGRKGGGKISGCSSFKGKAVELGRRCVIAMGGMIGRGHVVETYAKKID